MKPFSLKSTAREKISAIAAEILHNAAKTKRKQQQARARVNRNKPALWPEEQYAKPRTQGKSTRQEETKAEEKASQEIIPGNQPQATDPKGAQRTIQTVYPDSLIMTGDVKKRQTIRANQAARTQGQNRPAVATAKKSDQRAGQ